MAKGIYIIGTDTDVGKTVVSAGIMHLLRSNMYNACYYKPVSSGGVQEGECLTSFDVSFVKAVSSFEEQDDSINPYRFKTPVSPHLASVMENRTIDIKVVLEKYRQLQNRYDYIIAEGCGGLAVPLTADGYMQYQLIKELELDCILVSRTSLGTINHTLLTASFAESSGIKIRGIIFNGFNKTRMEEDNICTIQKLSGIPVLAVVPKIEGIQVENPAEADVRTVFMQSVDIRKVIESMSGAGGKCTSLGKNWKR